MHPEIWEFPSNQFYNGKITDGPKVGSTADPKLLDVANRLMFFNIAYSKESSD